MANRQQIIDNTIEVKRLIDICNEYSGLLSNGYDVRHIVYFYNARIVALLEACH